MCDYKWRKTLFKRVFDFVFMHLIHCRLYVFYHTSISLRYFRQLFDKFSTWQKLHHNYSVDYVEYITTKCFTLTLEHNLYICANLFISRNLISLGVTKIYTPTPDPPPPTHKHIHIHFYDKDIDQTLNML